MKMKSELFIQEDDDSIFYSRCFAEPILQLKVDELINPIPPNFDIPDHSHLDLQIPKDKYQMKKEITNNSFTCFISFKFPEFLLSSRIFNRFEYNSKIANFPVVPYNPKYIGIQGNLELLVINSLIPQYDPFKFSDLMQIINYYPELKKLLLESYCYE